MVSTTLHSNPRPYDYESDALNPRLLDHDADTLQTELFVQVSNSCDTNN